MISPIAIANKKPDLTTMEHWTTFKLKQNRKITQTESEREGWGGGKRKKTFVPKMPLVCPLVQQWTTPSKIVLRHQIIRWQAKSFDIRMSSLRFYHSRLHGSWLIVHGFGSLTFFNFFFFFIPNSGLIRKYIHFIELHRYVCAYDMVWACVYGGSGFLLIENHLFIVYKIAFCSHYVSFWISSG